MARRRAREAEHMEARVRHRRAQRVTLVDPYRMRGLDILGMILLGGLAAAAFAAFGLWVL